MQRFSADYLASLSPADRERLILSLSPAEAEALRFEWRGFWARDNQLAPPGDWLFWLLLAGRGFGKTRTAVEWIRERVDAGSRRLILAGATAAAVRDIMVEGESGMMACSPPWNRPKYEPSKARLTWPNGARAKLLSADEPERFRGEQCDTFWADELASWRYPDAWDQMILGFRLGAAYGVVPRGIISTTPRPTDIIRKLVKDASTGRCAVTRGSTFDNAANLAPAFLDQIRAKYEGTRLGRQEIEAEVLDDVESALWTYDSIAAARLDAATPKKLPRPLATIVVAVDPSGCSGPADKKSDEVGIVVVGIDDEGVLYVLEDASGRYGPAGPHGWGARAAKAYYHWGADRVVGEVNYGGAMVEAVLHAVDPNIPFREVSASRAKHVRAEPVAVLFEKGRAFLCGLMKELEEQLVQFSSSGWMGRGSPDRADAMVWGAYELGVVKMPGEGWLLWAERKAKQLRDGASATSNASDVDAPKVSAAHVPMTAPSHFAGSYYARNGHLYSIVEGRIEAQADDVEMLTAAGFRPIT